MKTVSNQSMALFDERTLPVESRDRKTFSSDDGRWQALAERDLQACDEFVYGVLTTGVYCRPTCASRRPNRENVRFFETAREAEQAGFRPCKRCRPEAPEWEQPHTRAVKEACKRIDEAAEPLSLKELASAAGLSAFHFQRLFKKIVGVTPKQYGMAKRANKVRERLTKKTTVTQAMYDAGFGSSSRFYEQASAMLGMKPSIYKNGAEDVLIRFAVVPCFLGLVLVAATERGICCIDFGDTAESLKKNLGRRFPKAIFHDPDAQFTAMIGKALAFLENPDRDRLGLPLDVQGTAFQRRVWLALQKVPPGGTVSYAEIASRIGKPKAARAVARACAANPVAVAIPCHRVVRANGLLGGYRWGVERKRVLLERERKVRNTVGHVRA
jgi:AraC family transcriptional regulator of adaptative response/methylated-DNA-[protein]-cysteine methyltransferase